MSLLSLQILLRRPSRLHRYGIESHPPVLGNRSECILRLKRCAEFARQHDVEFGTQFAGQRESGRYSTTRNRQHKRIAQLPPLQLLAELSSAIRPILEPHID